MRMVDLIEKKREGQALTKEEIGFIIREYTADKIPDYQMSALLMTIFYEDMTDEEIAALTLAMANSGEKLICHLSMVSKLINIQLAVSVIPLH